MTYFQVPVTQMPIAEICSSQSSYPAKHMWKNLENQAKCHKKNFVFEDLGFL
jgi:hypothetical protein